MDALIQLLGKLLGPLLGWLVGRPRLRVRIRKDNPDADMGGLEFEVENVNDKLTSLSPIITATYLSIKRARCSIIFDIREADRNLPPFTPKQFSASARERQSGRGHGWFRCYVFTPARGAVCRIRIRNAMLEPVGFVRFWYERAWFLALGRVFGKTSMTIDEFRARERSRGPH